MLGFSICGQGFDLTQLRKHPLGFAERGWVSRRFDGGGPFWSWFIADQQGKRLFCLDALCYAPGIDKIDYFRRMKAILHTFSLQPTQP